MDDNNKIKTYGREIGGGMLIFWSVITWWYFSQDDAVMVAAFAAGYTTMTISVFGLAAAMFGVDKVVKYGRSPRGRQPQRDL